MSPNSSLPEHTNNGDEMNALARVFPSLFGAPPKPMFDFPTEKVRQIVRHTPDMGTLEQYEFQLLFCPDRTQRGCSEYSLIEDSVYISSAFTLKKFNFYQQRDGLPVPLPAYQDKTTVGAPSLKIKGELHAIRPYQFLNLDSYKDNLVSFRRERVKILIPHHPVHKLEERYSNGKPIPLMTGQYVVGAERVKWFEAWMYIAQPVYWNDLLDGGFMFNPVTSYTDKRPWLGKYYSLKRENYF